MARDGQGIGEWMRDRWKDVEQLAGDAEAAGREAWAAATRRGENVSAARPSDVRALGAQVLNQRSTIPPPKGPPIRRGDGKISDEEIANIIFNETRSLSGSGIDTARRNIAHAVINGAEAGGKRPKSAPARVQVPEVERDIYHSGVNAVAGARYERSKGIDPTNGGVHFNFRPHSSTRPWKDYPLRTQSGPFRNSYPTKELPRDDVYSNTYED